MVLEGAESAAEVAGRMHAALTEVLAALAPGETGVVVTHGAALKLGLMALLGWDPGAGASLRGLDNCRWAVVEEVGPRRAAAALVVQRGGGRGRPRAAARALSAQAPLDFAFRRCLVRISRVARRESEQGGGAVAQLVAHLHGMEGVRGSSPLSSTASEGRFPHGDRPSAFPGRTTDQRP